MKRKYGPPLIALIVICAIVGVWYVLRQFNKKSEGAADKKADATVTSAALLAEFKKDSKAADAKYQKKDLQISGKISSIEKGQESSISVILQEGDDVVQCSFDAGSKDATTLKAGDNVTLKGLYAGFDDMMGMQIKCNKCALVE